MQHFLFVHFLERFTDLAEDNEGGGLIVGLSECWQVVEGAVLAELEHQVLFELTIKVIMNLLNPVGLAYSINVRKLENDIILTL